MHTVVLVFVHGLFGWGEDTDRTRYPRDYWYGLRRFLESELAPRPDYDLKISIPTLPSVDSIEVRGAVLQRAIEDVLVDCPSGTRVHLIAHSRGGMDARWVIAQSGMADKIASLTTVGTAHRGTSFMTWAYRLLPLYFLLGRVLRRREALLCALRGSSLTLYGQFLLGYDCSQTQLRGALYPLTFHGAAAFNRSVDEPERLIRGRARHPIRYLAYGGAVARPRNSFLRVPHALTRWFGTAEERAAGNDGACSAWSASFPWDEQGSDYVSTIAFDHYEQVNWNVSFTDGSDSLPAPLRSFYRDLIQRILCIDNESCSCRAPASQMALPPLS